MAPRKILQYDEEKMKSALEDVARGVKVYAAAKIWGVPRSSLRSKVKGINPISRKMGAQTAFSQDEELILENWVLDLARKGFPLSKATFLSSCQKLAVELKKDFFVDKLPSKKWFYSFMARHPRISKRVAQNLTKNRSAVTQLQLDGWKAGVYNYLKENSLEHVLEDPKRVFNADETAFFLQPKAGKVLAERGSNGIYQGVGSDEKECLTVLFNGNAAGVLAPPMIVFRYSRLPFAVAAGVPPSWVIGKSEQGWMNCELFFEYVANHFLKWLDEQKIEKPVIFFVDGHVSHMSLEVSKLCSEHGIVLVALFPNATHILQPMDVAVFHSFKAAWKEKTLKYRLSGGEVTKTNFSTLLNELLTESYRPEILTNGFRKCGLVPWDPSAVRVTTTESDIKVQHANQCSKTTVPKAFQRTLEELIGPEKIAIFRKGEPILTCDQSLYELWKKVILSQDADEHLIPEGADEHLIPEDADEHLITEDTDEHLIPEYEDEHLIAEDADEHLIPGDADKQQIPIPEQLIPADSDELQIPSVSPKQGSSKKIRESATNAQSALCMVPSPFKRTLFWPKPSEKACKRKIKEKVPSVVSSAEWQNYHEKKSSEKKKREDEKKQRQADRLQKRDAKERETQIKKAVKRKLFNEKKTQKTSDHSSDDESPCPSLGSSSGGEWDKQEDSDPPSSKPMQTPGKKIGEHVAVCYDGNYFPGKILEVKDSGAVVTAMVRNGKLWNWPQKEYRLFYSWSDIVCKVGTPKKFSKTREIYNVPEMENL